MSGFDVVVIGGGPAGLSAALSARENGAKAVIIEREGRLGGILKQCIHDGFGLIRFGERLTGAEYAERFIDEVEKSDIAIFTSTFVTRIEKRADGFYITVVSKNGVETITANAVVLATGCRERTARQVFIHGTRPSGIFTAGTAQHMTNLQGQLPTKKCVILGSGDIGLIMARRLTLEGAKVLGVYEAKPTPSGLTRNIHQCLYDFDIPLHLSSTVTRVFGDDRLTAVEISKVDANMRPIDGTQTTIECDALILSVGLIPENEIAEALGVKLDRRTKGAVCDGSLESSVSGVFCCGNALHVNDLVDYVSESGETAGRSAALYTGERRELIDIDIADELLYLVPQRVSPAAGETVFYFRSRDERDGCSLVVKSSGRELYRKKYPFLRPPEMERLALDLQGLGVGGDLSFSLEAQV